MLAQKDAVEAWESRHDAAYTWQGKIKSVLRREKREQANFSRCRWSSAMVHTSDLPGEMKCSFLMRECLIGSDAAHPPASFPF